jgi:hypothetical protein
MRVAVDPNKKVLWVSDAELIIFYCFNRFRPIKTEHGGYIYPIPRLSSHLLVQPFNKANLVSEPYKKIAK